MPIALEERRAAVVASQGRDPIDWEKGAAVAYRKAWAHPTRYGMYKRAMVDAYKACRRTERRLRNA